jgi:hypothetical protein
MNIQNLSREAPTTLGSGSSLNSTGVPNSTFYPQLMSPRGGKRQLMPPQSPRLGPSSGLPIQKTKTTYISATPMLGGRSLLTMPTMTGVPPSGSGTPTLNSISNTSVQSKNLVKAFTYNNFMPEEKPIPR